MRQHMFFFNPGIDCLVNFLGQRSSLHQTYLFGVQDLTQYLNCCCQLDSALPSSVIYLTVMKHSITGNR